MTNKWSGLSAKAQIRDTQLNQPTQAGKQASKLASWAPTHIQADACTLARAYVHAQTYEYGHAHTHTGMPSTSALSHPLDAGSKALIIGSSLCSITNAFARASAPIQRRLGEDCPFRVATWAQ